MPELQALISTYGWIGGIIWLLAERALPLFREWVVPESKGRATREQAEHEGINKLEERQVSARRTFKLEGLDEVLEKFEQLGERARQAVIEAAQAGADVVQAAANPNAPGPNIQTRVSEKKLGQATVDIGPDREH